MALGTILLVAALVLFLIACLPMIAPYRDRIIAAGLACWVASILVGGRTL